MPYADFVIPNKLGLHARAAAKLVSIASRHDCTVTIRLNGREVDARSIMGLLTLGATRGTALQIDADGPDAGVAMEEIQALFDRNFDED